MKTAFSIADTKNSPAKDLMLLALKIIEHAVSNQEAMNTSVNLSLYIIEVIFFFTLTHSTTFIYLKNVIFQRDTRDTYVNMVINTIQLWFVKREKLLQPPRFCSYATFVLQMYRGVGEKTFLLPCGSYNNNS